MADQHFWDNGIGKRSTAQEYKLRYEDLEGKVTVTDLMTLEKAADMFEQLKSNRQTVNCDLLHMVVNPDNTIDIVSQQKFENKVMDIGGVKIIL